MQKKKSKMRWILIAAAAFAAAGIGFYIWDKKREKPIEVDTKKVERRTIVSQVSATGKVQSETEVQISSEAAGEIIELPVKMGQKVKKGELLAKIKPDTYEAQVRQHKAAISKAKAFSLQKKAEMLQAGLDLKRLEELKAKDFISQSEMETKGTALEVAKASYESSLYDIQQMETILDEALEQLAKTTIYAPIDGTISVLNVELGERVVGTGQFAGTVMMKVADLEHMEVRIEVSENDIVHVKIGDPANITIDALPDKTFPGVVKEIANSAKINGDKTEEVTTFEVTITMNDLHEGIRSGMTATADIETDTAKDALAVPLQSVTVRDKKEIPGLAAKDEKDGGGKPRQNGKKDKENLQRVVFLRKNREVKIRPVKTGIADNAYIQILEGLNAGDEIITGSYSAITRELKDGRSITVKDAKSP